jgi:S-DNA-T family DNA segregation ATPase FtsK/SpoIIIE
VFAGSEPDRIRRFVTWLDGEVQRRTAARFMPQAEPTPWILLLIDGWEYFENRSDPSFVETSQPATLRRIITAGVPVGVHVVPIGGQDMLNSRLPQLYSQRLLLPFPKEETRRQHLTSAMISPPVLRGRAIQAGTGHHVLVKEGGSRRPAVPVVQPAADDQQRCAGDVPAKPVSMVPSRMRATPASTRPVVHGELLRSVGARAPGSSSLARSRRRGVDALGASARRCHPRLEAMGTVR